MSEEIKFDHSVDLKDHIEVLKKAAKPNQPFRVMRISADFLYDKAIHFEIVLRANRDGITKLFSTFISPEMYEKTIKPLYDKIESWELPNKRNPDAPPLIYPIRSEVSLEEIKEEDLSTFFDDFVDTKKKSNN